jgi:16S rRNA processing protein RimM
MAYEYNILLGRIIKVSGFGGAVTIKIEKFFTDNIPEMGSVFLEVEGKPVPFLISGIEYSGADLLKLVFEGYASNDKVIEFIGSRVFLTSGSYKNDPVEDSQNLIGYKVVVQEGRLLGSISALIPNQGQLLINVRSAEKKDILIPFHEHFIVSVDKKQKVIIMKIPEGLTEIN